tara:strand:+ start:94 stop:360 length:267 start_codon:yes stop_codon:yes gene_type:complete
MARRTMRKGKRGSAMRTSAKRSKVSRKSTRVKRSKSKSSKKSKGKKGMNAYMKAKEKARKSGAETFTYNGTTYKQARTKTGMVIYKKA